MFEDVDDILKGKRKQQPSNDDEAKRANFNSNRGFDNNGGINQPPSADEIRDVLQKRFGGDVIVEGIGIGNMIGIPLGDPKKGKLRSDGLIQTLVYIAEKMKLPPSCLDVAGKELAVGDVLKVPGGATKTVLKVGWKFVKLSKTEDQTKDDGVWFENEINDGNFIKI